MKRIIPFVVLVILATIVSYGVSSKRHSGQALLLPCSIDNLSKYLSLTHEQQLKVEPMFSELAEKRVDIVDKRDKATRRLILVLKSENSTDKQITEALRAVDIEQSRLRSLTTHHLIRLKSVLDKDQRQKLFDLVSKKLCISNDQGSMAYPNAKP